MSEAREDFAIVVEVDGKSQTVTEWTDCHFTSDFLTPTDSWSLQAPAVSIAKEQRAVLVPGAKVKLFIGGAPLAVGYLDRVEIGASRDSGATLSIRGRDALAPVVDSTLDPRTKFKAESTFFDLVKQCLGPYGFKNFVETHADARSLKTGLPEKASKKGKPIKSTTLDKQLRPHDNEGTFAFIQRVGTRLGHWVWASPDFETVIVGLPDFEQAPIGAVVRRLSDTHQNNVIEGEVVWDITDQPSFIVAEGYQGGQEWGHSKIRVAIMNPFVLSTSDAVSQAEEILKQFDPCPVAPYFADPIGEKVTSTARKVSTLLAQREVRNPIARPAFLHDEESKTFEQLVRFARREMSLLTRKCFTAHYTISGYTLDTGAIPCPDSIVRVVDEVAGIDELLWVKARTFKRSRRAGTQTMLELIRPYTLVF